MSAGLRAMDGLAMMKKALSVPFNREATARGLERCREILGKRVVDPFAPTWDTLDYRERVFWVKASRVPGRYADEPWLHIPQHYRDTIKNNLYRAAKRAGELLAGVAE